MKVSSTNVKRYIYNILWDPDLGRFEPVVAVIVVAASDGGCWKQGLSLRFPFVDVSITRVAHRRSQCCAHSSHCIMYIDAHSMYFMQRKLIKSLSHAYLFRAEWNNSDKIRFWTRFGWFWVGFGEVGITHIARSWAHSPSNLPSNSQIHRLIRSSSQWNFSLQNFKFWSDAVNQSKPQVYVQFSCLCWSWHWFSTHHEMFRKNVREWLYEPSTLLQTSLKPISDEGWLADCLFSLPCMWLKDLIFWRHEEHPWIQLCF